MRRKAWIAIRDGEVLDSFYVSDEPPTSNDFWHPEQVQIAGPVSIEAPPPPVDMVPMFRWIWMFELGYVAQVF